MKHELAILIVDDSPVIIERLTSLLNEVAEVHTILPAYSYEEGTQLIEKSKADVVILDINMPGKSGIDLLKWINEKGYRFKNIIMLTEDNSQLKKDMALMLGANHYLNKFNDFEMIPDLILKAE